MKNIKIGVKGLILEGEFKNWNVYIEDLDNGNGAYLILLTSPDNKEGYDDWVENFQSLDGYLKEANWKICWRTNNDNTC